MRRQVGDPLGQRLSKDGVEQDFFSHGGGSLLSVERRCTHSGVIERGNASFFSLFTPRRLIPDAATPWRTPNRGRLSLGKCSTPRPPHPTSGRRNSAVPPPWLSAGLSPPAGSAPRPGQA